MSAAGVVCVCALCCSLSLFIVKACTVARPGRQGAIHSKTGNLTSTANQNSDLQWASKHVTNSKMTWILCLGFYWEVAWTSPTWNNKKTTAKRPAPHFEDKEALVIWTYLSLEVQVRQWRKIPCLWCCSELEARSGCTEKALILPAWCSNPRFPQGQPHHVGFFFSSQ